MFLQNKNCYNYELRTYETGLFDTFVDVTYIITSLDDKKRNANIEHQLSRCIPTKQIYMVYNKIYKKCHKILPKQIPPYDIKDAYLNIMQHSIDQNYNNILVLENDFIYSDILLDNTKNGDILREIRDFFVDYSDTTFAYNLGPLFSLCYPNLNPFSVHKNTFQIILGGGTHACIFNNKIQHDLILEKPNQSILPFHQDIEKNIDMYLNQNYNVYFYKTPLIYQIVENTVNQNHWNDNPIIHQIIMGDIRFFQLDKQPEPGFSIKYMLGFLLSYLFFFILFLFFSFFLYQLFLLYKFNIEQRVF